MRADSPECARRRGACLFFLVENASVFLQNLEAAPFRDFHRLLQLTSNQCVLDALLPEGCTRDALPVSCVSILSAAASPLQSSKVLLETTVMWQFKPEIAHVCAYDNLRVADAGALV